MTSLTHVPIPSDSRSPRQPTGMTDDGEALYQCVRCRRHKRRREFGQNQNGQVTLLCSACADRPEEHLARQRYHKSRDHITITEQTCWTCNETKPAEEFTLDGKTEHGLSMHCRTCQVLKRRARKELAKPQWESFAPASTLQPVLDQAITERDKLEQELAGLREQHDALIRQVSAAQPRTDLLALNGLETEIRWVREKLTRLVAEQARPQGYVERGLERAALVVGPLAHKVWKWADRTVNQSEEG